MALQQVPLLRAPPLLLAWLVVVLAWLPAAPCYTVHVSSRARTQLAEFVRALPLAGDAVDSMDEGERSAWAADLKLTAGQTLEALGAPRATITVDVKLVGFDGDGNEGLIVADHELQAQLRTLHSQLTTVALNPEPAHLTVHPNVEFLVHPAFYQIAAKVNNAIAHAVQAAHTTTSFTDWPLALVNPDVVAAALEDDYSSSTAASGTSYTLYLLNPRVAGAYAYSYDADQRACPGGMYVSRQHRFVFYDLSANVTFYGPGPGGKGQVLSHSAPSLRHYRPEAMRRAVLPDLASLVWSAVQHLAWPPLHTADIGYHHHVAVHVVYMHQDLVGARSHVDRERFEHELRAAVGGAQSVEVHEHFLAFGDCPHCVAGYSQALRVRTAEAHEASAKQQQQQRPNEGQAAPVHVEMTQYLDLESLELFVKEWGEVVLSSVGVTLGEAERDGAKVVPVFVWDPDGKDVVLIEGRHQAAPLPSGSVVAVRSGSATVATFFGCHAKAVHADPSELQRPVMGAVLQAGWGVADTALFWSEATGRSWNWLWSLGYTPFGPLSTASVLSFAQRDAMLRNVALTRLNASVAHAASLVHGFVAIGGPNAHVKAFLPKEQVAPYNTRIALLLFKLQEAASALSRLDHAAAVGYAASTAHDVAALHSIVRRVNPTLVTELQCAGTERHRRWWALPGGAAVICVALLLWRCCSGGSRKEKLHSHAY